MKVICIKESIYLNGRYVSMGLTLGKTYDILDIVETIKMDGPVLGSSFLIHNDTGLSSSYSREIVLPLEEWREMRLNEILKTMSLNDYIEEVNKGVRKYFDDNNIEICFTLDEDALENDFINNLPIEVSVKSFIDELSEEW